MAVIENGTTPDQRIVTGRLDDLHSLIAHHDIQSPALIIVGEVVRLAAVAVEPLPQLASARAA